MPPETIKRKKIMQLIDILNKYGNIAQKPVKVTQFIDLLN